MDINKLIDFCFHWIKTSGIKLLIGVIAIFIFWKLINKTLSSLNKFLLSKNFDETLISFCHAFADIGLKFLLVVVVMDYVGIATSGIAALLASAGLAVGLALQGSLGNFAGGVIILILRPFKVTDYIECEKYQGVVEKITIFYTHIITVDNKEITIPNGKLSNGTVINYSSKPTRRVDLTISVGYNEDILLVKSLLNEIALKSEHVLKDQEPFIALSKHAASSLDFVLRVWTNTEDYWNVYFYLLEEVKLKFDENNISMPYQQMDIHMIK